jgi:hypothetical protein
MDILDVNEIKPGMILAKPVYNHQESLLLDSGTKMTEKKIRMFKSWGIAAVWVKGDSADNDPKEIRPDAEGREAIELELKEKFAEVLDNPVMLEIMRAAGSVLSQRTKELDEE